MTLRPRQSRGVPEVSRSGVTRRRWRPQTERRAGMRQGPPSQPPSPSAVPPADGDAARPDVILRLSHGPQSLAEALAETLPGPMLSSSPRRWPSRWPRRWPLARVYVKQRRAKRSRGALFGPARTSCTGLCAAVSAGRRVAVVSHVRPGPVQTTRLCQTSRAQTPRDACSVT